jgi:hypothetical protein
VGVDPQRDVRLGIAEAFGDRHDVDPRVDQLARVRVTRGS